MTSEDTAGSETLRALREPKLWLAPILVVSFVMALLGVLYLDSILDPKKNLHDFPIAVVNQDDGETFTSAAGDKRENFGDQITDALVNGVDKNQIDIRHVGIGEAQSLMRKGEVYGALIIPSDFSKRLHILGITSVAPGEDIQKPAVTINTNPRAGPFAVGIVTQIFDQATTKVNETVGKQLTESVLAELKGTPISGASKLVLTEPIAVDTVAYNALPDGTGNGLAPFYYALLLLLAGFTGSMIVSQLVDAQLGFAPAEMGPWYIYNPSVRVSRFHTLMVKWALMLVLGIVVSGIYVGIGALLDMPMSRPGALFAYGAFAITAVGISATAVMAALGSAGLIVNLIVFIILGVPSSGGTVPLEGQPPFFGWLANFEPLHQVFIGTRAILFYDARYDSGLLNAFWKTLAGLIFGMAIGIIATRIYDRKGFHRGTTGEPLNQPS